MMRLSSLRSWLLSPYAFSAFLSLSFSPVAESAGPLAYITCDDGLPNDNDQRISYDLRGLEFVPKYPPTMRRMDFLNLEDLCVHSQDPGNAGCLCSAFPNATHDTRVDCYPLWDWGSLGLGQHGQESAPNGWNEEIFRRFRRWCIRHCSCHQNPSYASQDPVRVAELEDMIRLVAYWQIQHGEDFELLNSALRRIESVGSCDTRRDSGEVGRRRSSCDRCDRPCTGNRDCLGDCDICTSVTKVESGFLSWCSNSESWFSVTSISSLAGLSKRGEAVMACPCNATYVSESCCGSVDGMVWEGREKFLGVVANI